MPVVTGDAVRFAELPGRLSADPLAGDLRDAAHDASASVRVVRIAPGSPRTPHRHPRSAEVTWIAEGEGIAWEDGTRTPVAAGDLILLPAGVPHATLPGPSGLVLVCFFPDPDLATNTEELDAPLLTWTPPP
ncbi:MAG: cupin domain-containing protein [Streptosporangiales bacterium]|nr:cupin domain-containing protein [Streptosporangiales bacterium]